MGKTKAFPSQVGAADFAGAPLRLRLAAAETQGLRRRLRAWGAGTGGRCGALKNGAQRVDGEVWGEGLFLILDGFSYLISNFWGFCCAVSSKKNTMVLPVGSPGKVPYAFIQPNGSWCWSNAGFMASLQGQGAGGAELIICP